MNKVRLYAILASVCSASLIISNILAFKVLSLNSFMTLDAGILLFPIVYIVNDVLAEVYGYKSTRTVIYTSFAMNLLAVILYNIAIVLPYDNGVFTEQLSFATVLGGSGRVLIASFLSYLLGSTVNAKVMTKMKDSSSLFTRCILSTLYGESVDSITFTVIAFAGLIPFKILLLMIITNVCLKTLYEILCFPVTNKVINLIK